MRKKPVGSIYVVMGASDEFFEKSPLNLLGVFFPLRYIVATPNGYLVIQAEDSDNPLDISDPKNELFSYRSTEWKPEIGNESSAFTDPEDLSRFVIPVTFDFIDTNTPKQVRDMIFSALSALGKIKVETTKG